MFPAITPPFFHRATFLYSLGRDMWALEQLLTFQNVTATIRSTVVRLQATDELWIPSTPYPTGECLALLNELPGRVSRIVLPNNAFEHKAPMKAFVSKFPQASVWIAPGQYGPFGASAATMGYHVDGVLLGDNAGASSPPWSTEFNISLFSVDIPGNSGPVTEVAFYHRPSRSPLVTDTVAYIPSKLNGPSIFETYFDAETVQDPSFWPRTVLQSVFLPLRQEIDGTYPGFESITDRLIRPPILRGFNDARASTEIKSLITQELARWDFDRIVTSHFASPINAGPKDLVDAFGYLLVDDRPSYQDAIACQDWQLLDFLNDVIQKYKLGAPASFDYKRGCQEHG